MNKQLIRLASLALYVAFTFLQPGCQRQAAPQKQPAPSASEESSGMSREKVEDAPGVAAQPDRTRRPTQPAQPQTPHMIHGPASAPEQAGGAALPRFDTSTRVLSLTGLSFSVPQDWVWRESGPATGPMAAMERASFLLLGSSGENAELTITYFPGMRGKDEMNLQRWYGQFTQPDGRPTQQVAKKQVLELGDVSITVVDITGTMSAGMPGIAPSEPKPDSRMITAIINHPKGPHFFKLAGPQAVVAEHEASVMSFLNSAHTAN